MIRHSCGTGIPPNVEAYVRHLASCPKTHDEIGSWCRAIVTAVDYELAHSETAETPTETPTETPAVSREMSASQMAAMQDRGASLRGIAAAAGVAPETVRRRIAKHERENGL